MSQFFYHLFETDFGWVGLVASEKGLRQSTLPQASPEECIADLSPEIDDAELDPDRFAGLADKIERFFSVERVMFDDEEIDVDDATPFHQAAWEACRSIPPGETRSYKWIAMEAGKPLAPRAAGQSMARNRLPIIVPCHRVIASDGSLRGFGKGTTRLDLKQRLLNLEESMR